MRRVSSRGSACLRLSPGPGKAFADAVFALVFRGRANIRQNHEKRCTLAQIRATKLWDTTGGRDACQLARPKQYSSHRPPMVTAEERNTSNCIENLCEERVNKDAQGIGRGARRPRRAHGTCGCHPKASGQEQILPVSLPQPHCGYVYLHWGLPRHYTSYGRAMKRSEEGLLRNRLRERSLDKVS